MASDIPPVMKPVAPFIIKGIQMEKADPVIAYYCFVFSVQQAIAKGLTKTSEGMAYTANLMDTLEQKKTSLGDHDAVTDELVGKIHVEQFAQKIFSNAENAQNAQRCTKQTAETFMASSVFFEVLRVFGDELEPEIQKKIVFAKYSATRILKALKTGEDPNLPEEEIPEEPQILTTDVEIPRVNEVSPVSPVSPHPPAPTVEDAVDDALATERAMANLSTADESLHPSRITTPHYAPNAVPPAFPSPPEAHMTTSHHQPGHTETMSSYEQFPTPPPQPPSTLGYFPSTFSHHETSVPSPAFDLPSTPPTLPSAPSSLPTAPVSPPQPPPALPSLPPKSPPTTYNPPPAPRGPESFYSGGVPSAPTSSHTDTTPSWSPPTHTPSNFNALPGNSAPTGAPYYQTPPQNPFAPQNIPRYPPAHQNPAPTAPVAHSIPSHHQAPPQQQPIPIHHPQQQQSQRRLINPDEDPAAVAKAQKHAKWAVSALNYDDVQTAVKELRLALATLGAE